MNVQKRENRVVASIEIRGAGGAALSIRTGLAWECGMIVIYASDVHVMIDREIQRDGTIPLEFDWATYHLNFGKQILYGQATQKTLTWVLYAESLYHESSRNPPQPLIPKKELSFEDHLEFNVLPVTQQMLRIREDVVEELRLMAHLENSFMEIFPTKTPLVKSILATLQQEWSISDVIVENKRSARPYTENPPAYLDIWNDIQGNETFVTFADNYNPVPTLRTRSDADLTQLTTPLAVLARAIIAVSSIHK